MTSSSPAPEPGLPDRLALFFEGLCGAVARHGARHRAMAPLMLLLWSYLRRTAGRFYLLVARFRAGRLRPTPPRPSARLLDAATPRPRLPRGGAWVGRLGWEFRGYAAQLQAMLNSDPDLRALLDAAPVQAGRLLGPLCRMLGVKLDPAELPPPRHKSAPPSDAPASSEPASSELACADAADPDPFSPVAKSC